MFERLTFERFYAGSQAFRDNIRFLSQFRLSTIFHHIIDDIEREKHIMADFDTDEARLEADVATETTLVTQVQAISTANTTEIATLNAEIAAQRAQGVDTTKLEATLSTLEGNNTALAALVPPAPTVSADTTTSPATGTAGAGAPTGS